MNTKQYVHVSRLKLLLKKERVKSELALVKKVCACEVCEYGACKELRKYNIKIYVT